MINYFLELEESIGKVWDRFLYKRVTKLHTNHSVSLSDISTTLTLFYHLLGGKKGKSIQATDKRTINTKRTRLEKISFMGKEFYLSWQDEKSLYLPPSLAFFPKKEDNEMLYYWLVAMLSQADVNEIDIIKQNIKLSEELQKNYAGFEKFYTYAIKYLSTQFEQLGFIKSLENILHEDLINHYPNPLWIYPALFSKNTKKKENTEEEELQRNSEKRNDDTLAMKKCANQIEDKKETDGFLTFLPESLMSIFEQVNVDRMEDDSFDENALYHAEDLDEITLGKKQANLSSRIKMDLDLTPDMREIYPLGKGHFIDEWDYKKESYLKNYVCIKPQITINVIPIELPVKLKKQVRKIQNALDILALERIKNDQLPYGDELNLDTWIEYKGHQNKSLHHQNFYSTFEKKTRDISTLILADVSLSTEGGITQELRIIDVIKDGLMVFSEALEKLKDKFAIYSFSSLQNKKVYFTIIKNFKEQYNELIRGRIDAMQPFYYTRLGAAIRESAKILEKQSAKNKLLLIISDGKPNDEDRYDGRYGLEDTKKAIEEVKKKGIIPFCITIDQEAKEYLPFLFGRNGFAIVKDGKSLPKVIPEIYINLTK